MLPGRMPRWRWSLVTGLDLQPRLTTAAERQLQEVLGIVSSTTLSDGKDLRFIDSPSTTPFSTREAYRMLSPSHATDVSACTSWGLRLPSKVRIFSYLADIDRLSTRANLFYKGCAPSVVCAACPMQETGRHLFLDCSIATEVWGCLRTPIPADDFSIWDLPPPHDGSPCLACGACDDHVVAMEGLERPCLQHQDHHGSHGPLAGGR
ncbi:hypothetical protein QYE76_015845 [Lolium multiflorum]|uniref:Reverse transcriptase zinc-binding domain-containing protein n=1 Tax=Lolium multiflorum TaxID=4521 RepID=A0AAD8U7R4_LOLMU|nr:hypothetical protein QYE76_015845 [Lolium multiflorum]